MNKNKQGVYSSFLTDLGEIEEKVETIREVIFEQKNLCYFQIFRSINKVNRDGFITDEEISLYCNEKQIKANHSDIEHLIYYMSIEAGNGISFYDFFKHILPHKQLLQYMHGHIKFEEERIRAEVSEQHYADETGEVPPQVINFWNFDLPVAIDFALKKFIIASFEALQFIKHKTFFAITDLNDEDDSGVPKVIMRNGRKLVNSNSLILDLIQIQQLRNQKAGYESKNLYKLNQRFTSKSLKDYILIQSKSKFLCDTNMIKAISRRLDKDSHGKVTVENCLISLSSSKRSYKDNEILVNRLLVKLDDEGAALDLFSRKLVKRFFKLHAPKKRPISSQPRRGIHRTPGKDSPEPAIDTKDLSHPNALTWKQLHNSGEKVAIVFTGDTRDYNFTPIGPFGKSRQKRSKTSSMKKRHKCKAATPGSCKLRRRKMFYPLRLLDLSSTSAKASKNEDPHSLKSYEFLVKRNTRQEFDASKQPVFVSISNNIFSRMMFEQLKDNFTKVLLEIVQVERSSENIRIELTKNPQVQINDILEFYYGNNEKGYISQRDIQEYMKSQQLTSENLEAIMNKLEPLMPPDRPGTNAPREIKVSKSQFEDMLLPYNKDARKKVLSRKSKIGSSGKISEDYKNTLVSMSLEINYAFHKILDRHVEIIELITEFLQI